MSNRVYLEAYSKDPSTNENSYLLRLPLESFITYCIYKYCAPEDIKLNFILANESGNKSVALSLARDTIEFIKAEQIPWQVSSCVYPVVLFDDTIITGLCAVARHVCKFRSSSSCPHEHEEGLLGFRKSCLQAPNEVSIWTKFCEIDILNAVENILTNKSPSEMPVELIRFENHLKKPVKVHNVYKIARNLKKQTVKNISVDQVVTENQVNLTDEEKQAQIHDRKPKTRKWKSNVKKDTQVDSSTNIEDLDLTHKFAEGPFLTLADLILLPSYHILLQAFNQHKHHLPLTVQWFENIKNNPEINSVRKLFDELILDISQVSKDLLIPDAEDVSLYKSDPKRHNPKKRLFTKENDIEEALTTLVEGMELNVVESDFKQTLIWEDVPDGANPIAGHLPDTRMDRKSQQLENLALAVLNLAKDGDKIVDFCSGSGHLGILLAHLLPSCTIVLLENKEQSLLRARVRVHDMGLKNVYFFQCNLDFFTGKFDIGIALHACGIASDLVLDKCLKANAKFVLCPCCYGSLHATNRLNYPRSNKFSSVSIDKYLCIGHAADQTHEDHPLTVRGARCMAVIDSDRGRLAEEYGYKVTLSKLKPLTCTPKNNLLIGVPA